MNTSTEAIETLRRALEKDKEELQKKHQELERLKPEIRRAEEALKTVEARREDLDRDIRQREELQRRATLDLQKMEQDLEHGMRKAA